MSRFVAREDIPFGGVLAYTRGQTVEPDAVEANGWQDYVVGENTQEAREIRAEITGRPAEDFEIKPATKADAQSSRRVADTNKQEG